MRLQDVPSSIPLIATADKDELQAVLSRFLFNGQSLDKTDFRAAYFGSYEVVEDAPWSGRILYPWPHVRGAEFPPLMSAECVADDIDALSADARYPQQPPNSSARKGWELRTTCINNIPALIVYPAWIH